MGIFSSKPGDNASTIMELLGCPCEYFPAGKPAQLIHATYEDAFAKKEMSGYTPVVIVVNDILTEQLSGMSRSRTLTDMKESYGEYWEQITAETGHTGGKIDRLSGFVDFGTKRSQEVIIAKIPTDKPWEVFAWIPFGGWNECPEPEVMMSVAKYWFEKYRAVPAVISHDVLEFAAQPVRDRSAAIGLALEQYAFCNDIIDQGFQELCVLADTLTKSSVWSFWWD